MWLCFCRQKSLKLDFSNPGWVRVNKKILCKSWDLRYLCRGIYCVSLALCASEGCSYKYTWGEKNTDTWQSLCDLHIHYKNHRYPHCAPHGAGFQSGGSFFPLLPLALILSFWTLWPLHPANLNSLLKCLLSKPSDKVSIYFLYCFVEFFSISEFGFLKMFLFYFFSKCFYLFF